MGQEGKGLEQLVPSSGKVISYLNGRYWRLTLLHLRFVYVRSERRVGMA